MHCSVLKYNEDVRDHRIIWTKEVLDDLKSHNLTSTRGVNMAQNPQLWRLLTTSGTMYVLQDRNDDDDSTTAI